MPFVPLVMSVSRISQSPRMTCLVRLCGTMSLVCSTWRSVMTVTQQSQCRRFWLHAGRRQARHVLPPPPPPRIGICIIPRLNFVAQLRSCAEVTVAATAWHALCGLSHLHLLLWRWQSQSPEPPTSSKLAIRTTPSMSCQTEAHHANPQVTHPRLLPHDIMRSSPLAVAESRASHQQQVSNQNHTKHVMPNRSSSRKSTSYAP